MNVYEISYQAALNGEYLGRAPHTAWDNYLESKGARIDRAYGDPELQFGSDHVQNVVNLIYSCRKQGGDEAVIELDSEEAKAQLWEHSYVYGFLPEVLADFELIDDRPILRVIFRQGVHTPGHESSPPQTAPIEKELAGMSKKELDDRLDEIFANLETNDVDTRRLVLPKDAFEALGTAVSVGSYRAVSLPDWIITKYRLCGDDAIPGKRLANAIVGLGEIFKLGRP